MILTELAVLFILISNILRRVLDQLLSVQCFISSLTLLGIFTNTLQFRANIGLQPFSLQIFNLLNKFYSLFNNADVHLI